MPWNVHVAHVRIVRPITGEQCSKSTCAAALVYSDVFINFWRAIETGASTTMKPFSEKTNDTGTNGSAVNSWRTINSRLTASNGFFSIGIYYTRRPSFNLELFCNAVVGHNAASNEIVRCDSQRPNAMSLPIL